MTPCFDAELTPVIALERGLVSGKEGPDGVVDEVEHPVPPPPPYPASLSLLRAAMLFSNTPSPRWASVPHGAERREGRGDLDPALREELGEIRLGGSMSTVRLHRSDDAPAELRRLRRRGSGTAG